MLMVVERERPRDIRLSRDRKMAEQSWRRTNDAEVDHIVIIGVNVSSFRSYGLIAKQKCTHIFTTNLLLLLHDGRQNVMCAIRKTLSTLHHHHQHHQSNAPAETIRSAFFVAFALQWPNHCGVVGVRTRQNIRFAVSDTHNYFGLL